MSVSRRADIDPRWSMPLVWAVAAVILAVLAPAAAPAAATGEVVYHVVGQAHPGLPMAVWAALCAVFYVLLTAIRAPYSVLLCLAQFGLTMIGAALMIAPTMILRGAGPPGAQGVVAEFNLFSRLQGVGYGLNLIGLLAFVLLLGQTVFRVWRPAGTETVSAGFPGSSPSGRRGRR